MPTIVTLWTVNFGKKVLNPDLLTFANFQKKKRIFRTLSWVEGRLIECMAFIRKVRTASGAIAVQIAYKEEGRVVNIIHIGNAHDEEEFQILLAIARKRLQANQFKLFPETQSGLQVGIKQSFSGLLWHTLREQYSRLGFNQLDDEVFEASVYPEGTVYPMRGTVYPMRGTVYPMRGTCTLRALAVLDGLLRFLSNLEVFPIALFIGTFLRSCYLSGIYSW